MFAYTDRITQINRRGYRIQTIDRYNMRWKAAKQADIDHGKYVI